MLSRLATLRPEFRPMFALAVPVVLAELGWMAMGVVDTLMVGRLSPEAIGAVGVGSSMFTAVAVFAMGLLLGLDTLVSQAFGAYLAVLSEEQGWSKTALSGAAALQQMEVALLGPVLGWLIDRFGPKVFVRAGVVVFGTGLCLLCKRLATGHFAAPWTRPGDGPMEVTMSELSLLLEGSELALRVRLSPAPYSPMHDGAPT